MVRKLDWDLYALCAGSDLDFFSDDPEKIDECIELCDECPVREKCLTWALQEGEHHGVWGGVSELLLREALSVNEFGKFIGVDRSKNCVNCGSCDTVRTSNTQNTSLITCEECYFSWVTKCKTVKTIRKRNDKNDKLE